MTDFDFLIIGSGIAGASAGAALAKRARVAIFEREPVHAYHTTGRSAAMWTALYGNDVIRALTVASRPFYDHPPSGFAEHPLLTPRPGVYFAGRANLASLDGIDDGAAELGIVTRRLDAAEIEQTCPLFRPGLLGGGLVEPNSADIDVNALHQGYLRLAKAAGADIRTDAEVVALEQGPAGWNVRLADDQRVTARVIVDAAGAWADTVAAMAGAHPAGLAPLKRTAFLVEAPAGLETRGWPSMIEADETFYFKPDSGRLLISPCDETPSAPCDAWAEDIDVAECVERLQAWVDLPVRRIIRSWAGLRTFAPDRTPVIGYDGAIANFFWLAGQGGYGVQTAPAAGRLAAALAMGDPAPADITALGLKTERLAPGRAYVDVTH